MSNKKTILVIDDDRSVRGYLSDFLTSCGYVVECLESGDQCLARLTAGNIPSLLVLDVVMPGIKITAHKPLPKEWVVEV